MISVHVLLWNPGNVAHIGRHNVAPEEVEQVCHGPFVVREAYSGRLMIIGPTLEQRMLTVVLDPEPGRGGVYYPVTARPASRKDRRHYREERGGSGGEKR